MAKMQTDKWIRGKQEVEIVDMILCIKNKLHLPANSNSTLCNPSEPCKKTLFTHVFFHDRFDFSIANHSERRNSRDAVEKIK